MMAVWGEGEGAWVDRELGRGRRSASASSEIFALYKVKHHKVRYAFLHILFALIFPNKNIKKERKGKLEKFRSGFVPLRSLGCCQGFAFVRVSFATIKLFNRNLFESPKVTRTWRPKKKREWPAKKVEWKRRLGKTKFVVGLIVVFIVANAAAATASLWYLLYYVQVLFSKWNEFQVHSAAAAVGVPCFRSGRSCNFGAGHACSSPATHFAQLLLLLLFWLCCIKHFNGKVSQLKALFQMIF